MSLNEALYFHSEVSLEAQKLGSWRHDRDLQTQGLKTLAQVQTFVSSNEAISFTLTDRVTFWVMVILDRSIQHNSSSNNE